MKINFYNLTKRIPGTGDFITIDNDKCNRCGRCLIICIMSLWKMKDKIVYIVDDYQSKCLECGGCYQVCDAEAINFRYPVGGTGVIYEQG